MGQSVEKNAASVNQTNLIIGLVILVVIGLDHCGSAFSKMSFLLKPHSNMEFAKIYQQAAQYAAVLDEKKLKKKEVIKLFQMWTIISKEKKGTKKEKWEIFPCGGFTQLIHKESTTKTNIQGMVHLAPPS